jgi:TonB family protein
MKKLLSVLISFLVFSTLFAQKKHKTKGDSIITATKEKIYTEVQQQPEFPGGVDSLLKFIDQTLVYPEAEKNKGVTGQVTLTFVVDMDGKIKNAKVERGIPGYPAFEKEALRVVSIMPRWNPGYHMGRRVSVFFTLPIEFTIK